MQRQPRTLLAWGSVLDSGAATTKPGPAYENKRLVTAACTHNKGLFGIKDSKTEEREKT